MLNTKTTLEIECHDVVINELVSKELITGFSKPSLTGKRETEINMLILLRATIYCIAPSRNLHLCKDMKRGGSIREQNIPTGHQQMSG